MERDEAIALLQAEHEFPANFQFRAVVRPETRAAVLSSMAAAAGVPAEEASVEDRPSRKGTYLALHVTMPVQRAEDVLAVYAVLDAHEGVITSL